LSIELKNVKRFALHNKLCYIIINHPTKPTREADKSYPPVDMYMMAGGARWGNKADAIMSYYRPNWHVDKNDSMVKIFIDKIKRKRTGGKQGDMDMKYHFPTRRFVDPVTNVSPLDPLNERMLREMLDQSNIKFPYPEDKPDTDNDYLEEAPF
jgi:hypothetical protein